MSLYMCVCVCVCVCVFSTLLSSAIKTVGGFLSFLFLPGLFQSLPQLPPYLFILSFACPHCCFQASFKPPIRCYLLYHFFFILLFYFPQQISPLLSIFPPFLFLTSSVLASFLLLPFFQSLSLPMSVSPPFLMCVTC